MSFGDPKWVFFRMSELSSSVVRLKSLKWSSEIRLRGRLQRGDELSALKGRAFLQM